MKPIDPLQLQRLVDGELEPGQVQSLLEQAKNSPDQWQQIAVGFVESQAFDRAFDDLERTNQSIPRMPETAPNLTSPQHAATAQRKDPESPRLRGTYSWMAMAASLLVAAVLGYMSSQIQNRDLPGDSIAESNTLLDVPSLADNTLPKQAPPRPSMPRPQLTNADYHLEVPEDNLGTSAPVPLYSVNNPQQLAELNQISRKRNTPLLSSDLLKQLAGSGYQVKQDLNYIAGRLNDGRSFVVPVRTIHFDSGQ